MIKLIYGIYKNVRDAALQCLVDYGIAALPVDLSKIIGAAGIKILKNTDVCLLAGDESGACFYDYNNQEWFLVYDDEVTVGRRRVAIAHELGHIFLGHELIASESGYTFNSHYREAEEQADDFMRRLLAPVCVLYGLNLHTAADIAKVCGMSVAESKKHAERMKELHKQQEFLTTPLEKKVYEQFKPFIEQNKNRNEGV